MSLIDRMRTMELMLEDIKEKLDRLLASGGEKEVVQKRIGDDSSVDEPEPVRLSSNGTSNICKSEGIPSTHSKLPEVKKENIPATSLSNFALPKTGKYQWYLLKNDDKVKLRRCSNEGCPMFLKFNEDKKKYEHWKYDVNTGVGGYVQDTCDYYLEVFKD